MNGSNWGWEERTKKEFGESEKHMRSQLVHLYLYMLMQRVRDESSGCGIHLTQTNSQFQVGLFLLPSLLLGLR